MEENTISRSCLMKILGEYRYSKGMETPGGNTSKEQKIIYFENGCLYQSYDSDVAAFVGGQMYVNETYHDYSNTTMRYCKTFTGLSTEQRRNKIKNKEIKTFD